MSVRGDLAKHRDAILAIARRRGVSHVRVFGSVARGTDRPDSDIDLAVRADNATLFDLAAIEEEIEALVGRRVQVVSEGGLNPRMRDVILQEAIAV